MRRHVKGEGKRIDALKLDKLREIANPRCTEDRGPCDRIPVHRPFRGCRGMRIPFEETGGRCVFSAEWDCFSRKTYKANFPEPEDSDRVFAEDVHPWANDHPARIPAHDVLLAGFPCQPFSIAGVRKKIALGRPHDFLCDTQGTLFYNLARIIDYRRPTAFLLENVNNLASHDGGKTFATIMHVLENELGYKVFWRVIDATPDTAET